MDGDRPSAAIPTTEAAGSPPGPAGFRLFTLLQLGDSFLPVGLFSYSHGLESCVADGLVTDLAGLDRFLADLLDQLAWTDGIAVLHAWDAGAAPDATDRLPDVERALLARKLPAESRAMAERTGRALWRVGRSLWPEALGPADGSVSRGCLVPSHAVAVGLVARAAGLDRREAFALALYGAAAGVAGAAVRLLPVDHLGVQRLLRDAAGRCGRLYGDCAAAGLDDMAAFQPLLDIESMRHEEAFVRLFAG